MDDTIRAMPAGPELDALVATRVMGWEPLSYTRRWSPVIDSREYTHRDGADNYWENIGVDEIAVEAWIPSTAIVCAWQVVEWLRSLGWVLSVHEEGGKSNQWVACFVSDDAEQTTDSGEELGETAPLAICRAALAVMALGDG